MYPRKVMSIETIDGLKIVYFHRKIYVPEKLRPKTIMYYFNTYSPASQAKSKLKEYCIWPDIEKDIASYEEMK